MFKKVFFAIVFQGSAMLFAQDGVLKIAVSDSITGEVLEAVAIKLESAGVLAATGTTDASGNLVLKNLAPGAYNLTTMYVAYPSKIVKGVLVRNNSTTYLDIQLSENVLTTAVITIYEKDLIDPGNRIIRTYDFGEISRSPVDPITLVSQNAVETKEGAASYRGQRPDGNVYIVDGMPVRNYNLPRSAIQQISVTLGGVPAQYGDGTGAFIEIETRSGLVNSRR